MRLLTACLLLCCSSALSAQQSSHPTLRRTLQRLARESQGRLGVGIELLETRDTLTLGDDFHYVMQSVYKLPIAMAVLHEVDREALRLAQEIVVAPSEYVRHGQHSPLRDAHPNGARVTVAELLRLTVAESDGSSSDVLLRLAGGAPRVMDFLRSVGVHNVIVATTEKEIGSAQAVQFRDWATPRGCLSLLRALQESRGLSDTSRGLLMRHLVETRTGLQRLRGQLPAATVVAHKTGTSGTVNGVTAATNDIGIVTLPDGRHLAVAVLLTNSRADEKTREAIIAQVARAAVDEFTRIAPR